MNNQQFATIQTIAEQDVAMPDKMQEIIDKNNLLPSLIQRWQKLYTKQNYDVQCLKINIDEMYGCKLKHYKTGDDIIWANAREIDSQINSDPDYLALIREHAAQKYYLDYIGEVLQTLKGLNYTIKNYLEYKKIITTNM